MVSALTPATNVPAPPAASSAMKVACAATCANEDECVSNECSCKAVSRPSLIRDVDFWWKMFRRTRTYLKGVQKDY